MRINYGYFEEEKLGKPYDIKLMMRLFPFVLPYRRFFSIAIFLIILITLLNLSIPYLTKIAIDRYIVPELVPITKSESETTSKAKPGSLKPASLKPGNARYMDFDFLKKEVQTVVKKYPSLFQLENNRAKILFSDLMKLKKEDIFSIRSNDLSGITIIALLFILVIGFNFIFNFLQIMVMEKMGQHITHDMRLALFSHIQSLSMSFFTRNSVGRLVTRVTNDVQNMHELFSSVLVFLFKDIFLCIGIACVLIAINFKLAMISFAILPFVAVASIFFSTRARDVFRQLRVKVAQINTRFSESIGGIKVIQLFLQEKNNYERFARLNHENYQAGMLQIKIFAIFMPVIEFLGVLSIAIIIYFGGRGVLDEVISLGSLVAFISYMKMLSRPIRDIAEKYNIMQNARASA
ncbi:ABC transporter ATP-binding protein [Desulfobacterales bacterium HSG16]|nr:ABC transporter ATP-binding protein [Desulfobacterales bacterium HSG16]